MELNIKETELHPPDKFLFPFTPYQIQEEFMKNLYITLEKGQLGVFESPTGTVRIRKLDLLVSSSWL